MAVAARRVAQVKNQSRMMAAARRCVVWGEGRECEATHAATRSESTLRTHWLLLWADSGYMAMALVTASATAVVFEV